VASHPPTGCPAPRHSQLSAAWRCELGGLASQLVQLARCVRGRKGGCRRRWCLSCGEISRQLWLAGRLRRRFCRRGGQAELCGSRQLNRHLPRASDRWHSHSHAIMAARNGLITLARALGPAVEGQGLPGALAQYSSVGGVAQYKLPELPYEYSALEPFISAEIMELHHKKHHATYVANVNKALEQWAEASDKGDLAGMISLQGALNFNGGGGCFSSHGGRPIPAARSQAQRHCPPAPSHSHASPPRRAHQPRHLLDQPLPRQGTQLRLQALPPGPPGSCPAAGAPPPCRRACHAPRAACLPACLPACRTPAPLRVPWRPPSPQSSRAWTP
jgi:hypothetical protein